MAAPTLPTLVTITTEALKKSGESSPAAALLTRAQDEWMEEIKADILQWLDNPRYLTATDVTVTQNGISRIAMPTTYFKDLSA